MKLSPAEIRRVRARCAVRLRRFRVNHPNFGTREEHYFLLGALAVLDCFRGPAVAALQSEGLALLMADNAEGSGGRESHEAQLRLGEPAPVQPHAVDSKAGQWRKRVQRWVRKRVGPGASCPGGFAAAEWNYRRFLAACEDCGVSMSEASEGKAWQRFNQVDAFMRQKHGDFWFGSFSFEQAEDAYDETHGRDGDDDE